MLPLLLCIGIILGYGLRNAEFYIKFGAILLIGTLAMCQIIYIVE